MNDETTQTTQTDPTARVFYSTRAAEEAYRQEFQRNEVLSAKLDEFGEKIDQLGSTLGEKLDRLSDLFERFLESQQPRPPILPFTREPKVESVADSIDELPPPELTGSTNLRVLNLPRSQSDPTVPSRREFLQRDRSRPPPSLSPTRVPAEPSPRRNGPPQRRQENEHGRPRDGRSQQQEPQL